MRHPRPSTLPTQGQLRMHVKPDLPESTAAYEGGWPKTLPEFERLVDAYLDPLVRFALRRVGNVQDAEDVVQNVLTAAFQDRMKRGNVKAVGPYLYRSVANGCIDLLRRRNCSGVFREEVAVEAMCQRAENPAEAADDWRRAQELLRRLPHEQAEVVRLRVFDELRLSEIAEFVGCSVNTVCSRLRYGLRKLRNIMGEPR